jgi:hypothetical protein
MFYTNIVENITHFKLNIFFSENLPFMMLFGKTLYC